MDASDLPPLRILLVDDDPADRALARREVQRALAQAQVLEAGSPQDLEAALAEGPVGLAVLDYSLGWANGPQVLEKIRALDPDCAAVLFTGSLGEEGAVAAMKLGFDDYVLKSGTAGPRLRSALEGALAHAADRRAARLAQADLALALQQKDDLLRELFHRVYNNLQQVEALINLQARRFEAPDVRSAFRGVADRLRTLGLVQQKLFRGDDYRRVDFAEFLRDLAETSASAAHRPDVQVAVEADAVALDVERAVPLGLIAGELIANSLQHGFPDGRSGHVWVNLTASPDERLRLEVRDDGIGAREAQLREGPGLGARLTPNLARQLRATLSYGHEGGLTVQVSL